MSGLTQAEWEKINEIVNEIADIQNIELFRKKFLQHLKRLVCFDLADFSLGSVNDNGEIKLINPIIVSGFSDKFEKMFAEKYVKQFEQIDYIKWIFSNRESMVYKESEVLSPKVRIKSAFYLDYLKPMNLTNVAGMSIVDQGECLGAVTLFKAEEKGDYSDRDVYILNLLLPHIKTKLKILTKHQLPKIDKYEKILSGKYGLSRRETEILKLICGGQDNRKISESLSISINTVKKHMSNILAKFEVENRLQLTYLLLKNNKELFAVEDEKTP